MSETPNTPPTSAEGEREQSGRQAGPYEVRIVEACRRHDDDNEDPITVAKAADAEVTRLTAERDALAQQVEAAERRMAGAMRSQDEYYESAKAARRDANGWKAQAEQAEQDAARLRLHLSAVVEAYDRYRGRGVNPAPNEYANLAHQIDVVARAALIAPADPTGGQ